MIKQFNFYKSYSDNFTGLNNAEAGKFTKLMLKFMFCDEEPDSNSTDKTTSLFLQLYDMLSEEKSREERDIHTPAIRGKHFAFYSVYANIFLSLKDIEAGILIKKVCDYMFGISLADGKENAAVKTYFSALKRQLSKSKAQSLNAVKRKKNPVTLEQIRKDFPNIKGNLSVTNEILKGVNLNELYNFIKENSDKVAGKSMYEVVEIFRKNGENL